MHLRNIHLNIIKFILSKNILFIFCLLSIYKVVIADSKIDIDQIHGSWICEPEIFESEHFSYESQGNYKFNIEGGFEALINYVYSYNENGSIDVTYLIHGNWSLVNESLKIVDNNVKVKHLKSKLVSNNNLSLNQLKSILEENYILGKEVVHNILSLSENEMKLLDINSIASLCKRN